MEPPDDVRTAWQAVIEQWDDRARHEEFLGRVAQHNCFAWAAARYKERAGDATADHQLAQLRRAATATMLATARARPEREPQPYRSTIVMIAVLVLGATLGLVCTKLVRDSRPAPVTRPGP